MTPSQALSLVLDEEHATAIVDHRKAMKKPLTEFAAKLLAKEFAKCADPNLAAEAMLLNGWRGFNATWITNNGNGNHASARASSPSEDLMRSFGIRPHTEH